MLSTVSFLSPCRPMMEMIENQVFLSQKMYAKVTGRSETLLPVCEKMHYETIYQPDLFQVDDQRWYTHQKETTGRADFFHKQRIWTVARTLTDYFFLCGLIAQNTIFIMITISRTAAMDTQNPMLIPSHSHVPKSFIQSIFQFILFTS